jgi:uncharacterized protein YegP (UPF0339 family)
MGEFSMAGNFEVKLGADGRYMFNLVAGNGQVILTSQMYASRASAVKGIESVRNNARDEGRFERRTSEGGKPYFVLIATNGEIIGTSERYSDEGAMEKGISSVRSHAPDAGVLDSDAGA